MPSFVDDPVQGTGYALIQPLAQSRLSEVVDAHHPRLGRVVVKVLRAEHLERRDIVRRVEREGEILRRLAHPNLVRVLDVGVTPAGRPFVVTERLFGATFSEEVGARGRLPVVEAIMLVRQVLRGVDAVHRAGVAHRDIKPANLFLCRHASGPPVVKILDFGVAKLCEGASIIDDTLPFEVLTEPLSLVGTPRYAAPEQIRGEPVDARADLYAVGLVLYYLVAGHGPFDAYQHVTDAMRAQLLVKPPSLSSLRLPIPPDLDAVLERALAKRPDERFASARDFDAALAAVSAGYPTDAPPGQPPGPKPPRSELRRKHGRTDPEPTPSTVIEVAGSTAVGWPPRMSRTLAAVLLVATTALVVWLVSQITLVYGQSPAWQGAPTR